MLDKLKLLCASPRLPLFCALLAALLCLPTLFAGPMSDDYAHYLLFHPPFRTPGGPRGDWDMFRFQDDNLAHMRFQMDLGLWPWWTSPSFRLAFMRPLASLLHALDYRAWPSAHWLMHAESVALYAATCFSAGLVYRRLLGATAVAGLAALLFAVDDAHSMVVAWIANRHAILSALFGLLALAAHDRARHEPGSLVRRSLGPLAFALSMLAGESGVATVAYLFAYAMFLDPAPFRDRIKPYLPYAVILAAWVVAYRIGGYGAHGGAFYIDPVREPAPYLAAVIKRLPALLAAQLALPPADLWIIKPALQDVAAPIIGYSVLLVIGGGLILALRRDKTAGFFATGLVLCLLPACATWPSDRLLLASGLGGFGLVAMLLGKAREHLGKAARIYVAGLAGLFILFHVILAPALLPLRVRMTSKALHGVIERGIESLPPTDLWKGRTIIAVNSPDALELNYASGAAYARSGKIPRALRQLSATTQGTLTITRVSPRTLSLVFSDGFLHEPTTRVFRNQADPLEVAERIEVAGMVAEVKETTENGEQARRIDCTFEAPLDSPDYLWIVWEDRKFVPFVPPAEGETRVLPAIDSFKAMAAE